MARALLSIKVSLAHLLLFLADNLRDVGVRLLTNLAQLVLDWLRYWLVGGSLVLLLHDELVNLGIHHVLLSQTHALELWVDIWIGWQRLLALVVAANQNLV